MNRKFSIGLTIALLVALLVTAVVLADNLLTDGDGLTPVVDTPSLALGDVCTGTSVTKDVLHAINANGHTGALTNVFADGAVVTVSIASVSGSGLSATGGNTITLPYNWTSYANNSVSNSVSSSITFNAGSTPNSFSGTINYNATGLGGKPDNNGNYGIITRDDSLNVTATVVICDSTAPTLNLPANITAEATSASGAAVTFSATADDTNPAHPSVTCDPASGSIFAFGLTTVYCSASDAVGNKASGSFTVTVQDTTPPAVTPPSDIIVEAVDNSGATVSYSGESALDTVDGALPASCLPASGVTFPLGSNTVICSSTDSHGNTGTSSFTINVKDSSAPVLVLPSDITEEATGASGAAVDFSVSASDLVDGLVAVTCDRASGGTFALGTTEVSCSAADSNGNKASGSFKVTVQDTTPPVLTLPADLSEEAIGPSGAIASFSASAYDLVDGAVAVTCVPSSGATFALGNNLVSCFATDNHGNIGSNSFEVSVVDTTAPDLTLPADQELEATGPGGAAATFAASATDLVDGVLIVSCDASSGDTFPLGTTTVTCSVEDAAGNMATGSFVIIVEDTTPPVLIMPSDQTFEGNTTGGYNGAYIGATVTDIVDKAPVVACSPASGSIFALGDTTVTCTATDASGNSNSGSFKVTVVDTTPPVLTMPLDQTFEGNTTGGYNGAYIGATATDIVDAAPEVDCLPASGSFFALGDTTVTCTATDASGNSSNASFDVTVVDTTAPALVVMPDNMTVEGNTKGGASVTFTYPTATDIVDKAPVVACSPASGSFFALGDTTVTCTATDASGNSNSGSFKVTVVDTTPPVLTMPLDQTFEGNTTGGYNGAYIGATATDIVDAAPEVDCLPASGSFFALGDTTVTCTATDASGNSSNASFVVTVIDTTPPVITFVSRLPAANSFGWNNSDVAVRWSCSDIVGVVAPSITQIVSAEGADQSVTGTCEDTSGNKAYSDAMDGINIDKTKPTITWNGGPVAGGSYYFDFIPAAPTCTALDALSGPNGCSVTGYGITVGGHTLTATAYDKAGNEYSESRTYTVLAWILKGFYQPVDMNGVLNTIKGGSTVPLKFEVFAGTTELTDTSIISASIKQVTCNATLEDSIEVLATGGTILRYDPIGGQFIFNWQTPKLPGKCYMVTLTTSDGSKLEALFKLK